MESKVKVNIYGNEYNITGDADPEYIQRVAKYLSERMEETGKSIVSGNVLQIAILTALNVADEYFQLREMSGQMSGALMKKTEALISMLEEGIIGDSFAGIETSLTTQR